MNENEFKKLRIALWSLTVVVALSVLVEVGGYLYITQFMGEVNAELNESVSDPDSSDILEEHYKKGEYDLLEGKASERIKTHPNDEYSYYYLGLMYFQKGDFKQAYHNLEITNKLDPTWSRVSKLMKTICSQINCDVELNKK